MIGLRDGKIEDVILDWDRKISAVISNPIACHYGCRLSKAKKCGHTVD